MRRLVAVALIAGLAAGCGAAPKTTPSPITLAGTLDNHRSAGPSTATLLMIRPAAFAPTQPPVKLLCDAPSLAYLVGRPRTEIPVPADLSRRRVACTTCVGPADRQPTRTDIIFDARTGIVTAVTCG
jgi:hypothetical protein